MLGKKHMWHRANFYVFHFSTVSWKNVGRSKFCKLNNVLGIEVLKFWKPDAWPMQIKDDKTGHVMAPDLLEQLVEANTTHCTGLERLCILLCQLAQPNCLEDIKGIFRWGAPEPSVFTFLLAAAVAWFAMPLYAIFSWRDSSSCSFSLNCSVPHVGAKESLH